MKKRLKIKQLLLGVGLSILGLLTFSNSNVEATAITYSDGVDTGFSYNSGITFQNENGNADYIIISSNNNGVYSFLRSFTGYNYSYNNCTMSQSNQYVSFSCADFGYIDKTGSYNTTTGVYIDIYRTNNKMILSQIGNSSIRDYYLPNTGGASTEDLENAYDEGYRTGENAGLQEGYQNGYNVGSQEGYQNGYNAGISSTEGYQSGYEAGLIAGRQEGYQNGYDTGYQEGYDEGYVTNNTIPNIYIQSSNLIFDTGLFPFQISITDYINNLNGKLDLTALYNYDFTGAPNQNMQGYIVLNTQIPVTDTLKFDLIDGYDQLSNSLWIILGNTNNSCNNEDHGINCIVLDYEDLVNNNYLITASTLYPNLNITEFNYIQLSFDYYNNMLYGIKSITDITMTSTADSEYDIGYNVGYIVGKNEGMLLGRTEAYNLGYEAGLDYQFNNENTITGMMGTLFTMPINMFKTIFDFEFLGVNLAGFFLSLVTLLVVIWLIKKFI